MECGKRHGTAPFKEEKTASYRDCLDGCAKNPKCISVDWSSRSEMCYYYTQELRPRRPLDITVPTLSDATVPVTRMRTNVGVVERTRALTRKMSFKACVKGGISSCL